MIDKGFSNRIRYNVAGFPIMDISRELPRGSIKIKTWQTGSNDEAESCHHAALPTAGSAAINRQGSNDITRLCACSPFRLRGGLKLNCCAESVVAVVAVVGSSQWEFAFLIPLLQTLAAVTVSTDHVKARSDEFLGEEGSELPFKWSRQSRQPRQSLFLAKNSPFLGPGQLCQPSTTDANRVSSGAIDGGWRRLGRSLLPHGFASNPLNPRWATLIPLTTRNSWRSLSRIHKPNGSTASAGWSLPGQSDRRKTMHEQA